MSSWNWFFAFDAGGGQQILDQFEHADDVPLGWRAVFRDEENNGGQEPLGGVIKNAFWP